ncbi:hypothetical protein [Acetobacter estunensis]|uniref:hypothetical protein n=1 Tax=Acetobacter estunensis TaxID=104097 RepID=UPI001C2D8E60|nr:hypothetical protein [Acetobacter estunensis]MBV1835623.1 hypothetical protein [Acetobacter estunensis]MBV1836116.1 hypothetical protein [Acetobacter estunensis]
MTDPAAPPLEIDVGACGEDFPLWATREAVKSAEACLAETQSSRESLVKTVTSVIGWCLPISVVLVSAPLSSLLSVPMKTAAIIGLAGCVSSMCVGVYVICVRTWAHAGILPADWEVLITDYSGRFTEISVLTGRLKSLEQGIADNKRHLRKMGKCSRLSVCILITTPVVAVLGGFMVKIFGR